LNTTDASNAATRGLSPKWVKKPKFHDSRRILFLLKIYTIISFKSKVATPITVSAHP
jgi:hypothetical protein